MSSATPVAGKEDQSLSSADSGKIQQNAHQPRTNPSGNSRPEKPPPDGA
jgi:hypothetical protein